MGYRPEMSDMHKAGPARTPRLLDEVRRVLRTRHYSLRTEHVYVGWIRRFILANGKRHPRDMGAAEVEQFLSRLAVQWAIATRRTKSSVISQPVGISADRDSPEPRSTANTPLFS